MSEYPRINFNDGTDFEMRPDNTSLFTFAGAAAMYNHVFLTLEEVEENHMRGTYIFSENSGYVAIATYILEHNYPAHLNMLEAAECDQQAWRDTYMSNLDDELKGLLDGDK